MSRDDDDLIKGNKGNDFAFEESEEFSIPESPYSDDGEELDDDFAVDEMDFTVDAATSSSDDDFELPDIEIGGDDSSDVLDNDPDEAYGEHEEHETSDSEHAGYPDEEDQEEELHHKPGWKIWAGLAAFGVFAVGALTYLVMPMFMQPTGNQGTADMMPQMANSPAGQPTNLGTPAGNEGGSGGSNNFGGGSGSSGMGGGNHQAPVSVSPFPLEEEQEFPQAHTQDAQRPVIPDSTNAEPVDRGRFNYDQARAEILSDRAAQDLEKKMVDKKEFAGLKTTVRENVEQLQSLALSMGKSEQDIVDLDRRVSVLERKIEAGYQASPKGDKASAKQLEHTKHPILSSKGKIAELQKKLADKNYRPGKVDGIFGAQTQWAIKRAQQEHGLSVTGELDEKTMAILDDLKRYSGTYQEPPKAKRVAKNASKGVVKPSGVSGATWYLRGLTSKRAIVYRANGESYPVSIGTEVPGMGQVLALYPEKHEVVTAHGTIRRQ